MSNATAQIILDTDKLSEREEKIVLFESFVDCLKLFKPEIEKRFEAIEGVTSCHVGYNAEGFTVQVEAENPEMARSFLIEYKHVYLDMLDGIGKASPLVNHLNREIARWRAIIEEAELEPRFKVDPEGAKYWAKRLP